MEIHRIGCDMEIDLPGKQTVAMSKNQFTAGRGWNLTKTRTCRMP